MRTIQRTFDSITATLEKERHIDLRNFGVFEVRKRQPRVGRPRTGKSVNDPAKLVVTFRPGLEWRTLILFHRVFGLLDLQLVRHRSLLDLNKGSASAANSCR